MQWRVKAAVVVTAVAVLTIGSAHGATAIGGWRPAGGAVYVPNTSISVQCAAATQCTHGATADEEGNLASSASTARVVPSTSDDMVMSTASGQQSLRLKQPVKELRVTFTWHIDEAEATRSLATDISAIVTRVLAHGTVTGCADSCTATHEVGTVGEAPVPADHHGYYVVDSSSFRLAPSMPVTDADVFHTVTLRSKQSGGMVPAGRYFFTGKLTSVARLGAECLDIDEESEPMCREYAGEAEASATGSITSIEPTIVAA